MLKAVKKSKAAEKPAFIFKKKGNEVKAKFNAQVEDAVEEAIGGAGQDKTPI